MRPSIRRKSCWPDGISDLTVSTVYESGRKVAKDALAAVQWTVGTSLQKLDASQHSAEKLLAGWNFRSDRQHRLRVRPQGGQGCSSGRAVDGRHFAAKTGCVPAFGGKAAGRMEFQI